MTPLDWTLLAAVAVANTAAFCLMGADKRKARRGGYRVPESTLLLWCGCLGALGGWLGMRVYRHKTSRPKFTVTVPTMLALQAALFFAYLFYWR